jgi:hypothetical protein
LFIPFSSIRKLVFQKFSDFAVFLRIETEQENDQSEDDRDCAHGLFGSAVKNDQGEKGEESAEKWTRDGEPKGDFPV